MAKTIGGIGSKIEFDRMEEIKLGEAMMLSPKFPGDIVFSFDDCVVEFGNVSTAMFFDDGFENKDVYPYEYIVEANSGLFEVHGSSYLRNITNDEVLSCLMFRNHRHFVYFDKHFLWNITADGFSVY